MNQEELQRVVDEHKKWLESDGKEGARADLPGVDFSGAMFNEANLSGATLSGANLSGADLCRAGLSKANLVRANLSRANLSGAILDEANLSGAIFVKAIFVEATLSGADLYKASLDGANLSKATLSGAILGEANLSGANLVEADLSGTELYNANLSEADLSRANLSRAYLYKANLSGADLNQANLSQAYLSFTNLAGANLAGTDLRSVRGLRAEPLPKDIMDSWRDYLDSFYDGGGPASENEGCTLRIKYDFGVNSAYELGYMLVYLYNFAVFCELIEEEEVEAAERFSDPRTIEREGLAEALEKKRTRVEVVSLESGSIEIALMVASVLVSIVVPLLVLRVTIEREKSGKKIKLWVDADDMVIKRLIVEVREGYHGLDEKGIEWLLERASWLGRRVDVLPGDRVRISQAAQRYARQIIEMLPKYIEPGGGGAPSVGFHIEWSEKG